MPDLLTLFVKTNLCNNITMKFKILSLLSILFSLSLTGCNKDSESADNKNILPESQEDYINPSNPNETGEDESDNHNLEDNPQPQKVEPLYDELSDSVENVDTADFSELYSTFSSIGDNYTSTIKGYFNEDGSYDYYRHYQKNYVCDKTCFFTNDVKYTLPELDDYLSICNSGLINLDHNYYTFALQGYSKEERMAYSLKKSDLTNEIKNKKYQDDLFTISDLNQTYFEENDFTRISKNKYESTKKEVREQFIDICAPDLINSGYYLTFSRITIELNPLDNVALRIRLYVNSTQSGKLIGSHKDRDEKPNWYLLFSEAYISNVGSTSFAPANELLM